MSAKSKLSKLVKAANALRIAAKELEQIRDDKSDGHYLCEDARFMLAQVNEVLDADHGQAGLDALIRKVNQKVGAL